MTHREMTLRQFLDELPNGTAIVVDEVPNPDEPDDVAVISERVMQVEGMGMTYRVLTETRTLLIPENGKVVVVTDE